VARYLLQPSRLRHASRGDSPICRTRQARNRQRERTTRSPAPAPRTRTAQIGELEKSLDLISWKVGVYEERLAQGTAAHLWTAARRLGSKNRDCRVARDRNHAPGLTQRIRSKLRRYTLLSGISREAAVGVGGRAARRARLLSRRRAKDTSRTSARATGLGQASCRRVSVR